MSTTLAFALLTTALLAAAPSAQDRTVPDGPKAAELRQKFQQQLDDVATGLDGVMGYAIVDLTDGARIERLPDEVFATASTIKLAILYEMFKQAEEGRLRLDEPRAMTRADAVGGSGVLSQLSAPSMPLRDYATLMVILSDNSATNVLIDAVGMDRVNARMAALGLANTKLRRKMMDGPAARRGNENVSTPREIARLLEIIYKGDGLTPPHKDELIAILSKPKSTPIHRGIPRGVRVASKSGNLEGIEADAGIVYVEGRPYVICVMTGFLREAAEGKDAIAAASEAAFAYFDRLAKSSEYGRVIR